MSFSLIGPFSFGAKVSSAQFNQLDSDHANSLDKSTAGDAIAGTVTFVAGGKIQFNQSGSFDIPTANAGTISGLQAITINGPEGIFSAAQSGITSSVLKGINSIAVGGISTTHAGGISPSVFAGITDGAIAGGIVATVPGGIISGALGGISDGAFPGGISATVAGGIQSGVDGGLKLTGTTLDYLTYGTLRSYTYVIHPIPHALSSGWTMSGASDAVLLGPGTAASQFIPLTKMFNGITNGATLTTVKLIMAANTGHGSVASMVFPHFSVNLVQLVANIGSTPPGPLSLFSGGSVAFPNPGSGAAWDDSGFLQSLTLTCNQNNVIDTTENLYFIQLNDESGTGSQSGNAYYGFELTFVNVFNSAPGF